MKFSFSPHWRLPQLGLSLLLCVYLAACDQSTPESRPADKTSNVSVKPETPAEPVPAADDIQEIADGLVAIENQVEEPELNSNANADADADNRLDANTESSTDLQADQSKENLVESIGFAQAQQDNSTLPLSPVNKAIEYKATCNHFGSKEPSNIIGLEEERSQFCAKISNRLASVSSELCMRAKLIPSGCDSVDGVPLMVREFPPLKNKEPLGRVLVIGGTHGDELTSVSVTFRWLEKLNEHHSGLFHWHIIPSLNPDGLLKRGAERTNHNGVDLNRNMPSEDWEQNALSYWRNKGNKDPRKYPGIASNSEPETQWLVDEINVFKPDAIIAVHAPYGVVDFDALKLNTAPKSLGKLHLNLLGTYPGSLGNYAGINLNIPVITLELPHSWEMPSEQESDLIWQDIVQWLKNNIDENDVSIGE